MLADPRDHSSTPLSEQVRGFASEAVVTAVEVANSSPSALANLKGDVAWRYKGAAESLEVGFASFPVMNAEERRAFVDSALQWTARALPWAATEEWARDYVVRSAQVIGSIAPERMGDHSWLTRRVQVAFDGQRARKSARRAGPSSADRPRFVPPSDVAVLHAEAEARVGVFARLGELRTTQQVPLEQVRRAITAVADVPWTAESVLEAEAGRADPTVAELSAWVKAVGAGIQETPLNTLNAAYGGARLSDLQAHVRSTGGVLSMVVETTSPRAGGPGGPITRARPPGGVNSLRQADRPGKGR